MLRERWIAIVVGASLALALAGCSRAGAPAGLTACTDPRPEICTREYLPVCGSVADGASKTYGNACEACADPAVSGHRPGEC